MKRRKDALPPQPTYPGYQAHAAGQTLRSWTVGALPILNRLLERMRLEAILQQHLPPDDPRVKIPTATGLLLLVRNLLLSREPIYGVGEWAERYAPDLLGLANGSLKHLNDDRLGRCLDRLFDSTGPDLLLGLVRHVIREFGVSLDELHNDSTTVSFYGAYEEADEASLCRGRPTIALTYGHSKDHRPDLKQLLYTLTVTDDGGVPVYGTSASGNVTDDQTHRETWDLMCQLVGRPDFLYVADCKLEQPNTVSWEVIDELRDEEGFVLDRTSQCRGGGTSAEGYRLLWLHSSRKAQQDAATRSRVIDRALKELGGLRERLVSPKTRFRQRAKVEEAVAELLANCTAERWVRVEIQAVEEATYKQSKRGRPTKTTQYVKEVRSRFELKFEMDAARVAEEEKSDGVFPLVSNAHELSGLELLRAYKRQPLVEKRFSQFKTDYKVAPVYLKEVSRIQALLVVYFFVLLVQTLLERELRGAMRHDKLETLALYPEGRGCRHPTTRRVLDVLEPVQRHELTCGQEQAEVFVTDLTKLQREVVKLMGLSPATYGR